MRDINKLINIFSEASEKFGNKPLLISIRRGFTYMIPLVLLGSIALIFTSLPVPAYQNLMAEVFGSQWKNIFLYIRDGTFNILSPIMVISISYSYIVEFSDDQRYNVNPVIAALVSLCSFVVISGISKQGFRTSIEGNHLINILINSK